MARGKKAKSGNKVRSKSLSKKENKRESFVKFSPADSPPSDLDVSAITLRDAARNSEYPRSIWSPSGLSLRQRSMKFICSQETCQFDNDQERSSSELRNEGGEFKSQQLNPLDWSDSVARGATNDVWPEDRPVDQDTTTTKRDPQVGPGFSGHSPSTSVSSEEVVFLGRNNIDQAGGCVIQAHQRRNEEQMRRKTRHRRWSEVSSSDGNSQAALDDYAANLRESGENETLVDVNKIGGLLRAGKKRSPASAVGEIAEMGMLEKDLNIAQQTTAWENRTVNETSWIPGSSDTMPRAINLIKVFENQEEHLVHRTGSDETELELNWQSSEFDRDADEDEDFEDDRDLIERRQARMTDEHIASLLQKQESFGFNSETLQIFDGIEDFEVSEDTSSHQLLTLSRKKRDQKRRKPHADAWLDTADDIILDGDDYGSFDIMDHERSSLSKNKKPDGDLFLLHLSDPELAQGLQENWTVDRKKKRLKKQEREQLRFQGLLGKKNKSQPDLQAKYISGMSLTQVEDELHEFLFNEKQDYLSLPTMSKRDRKLMHDIANAFGLKSKSKGPDTKRFTILYKTSRTSEFDQPTFERLLTRLNRRFLPRADQTSSRVTASRGKGVAPGRSTGDGGYREGEIVGAAAPELGMENRGRAMLMKMGWSTGTALGALNNQGILKPIEHVVKNSRAGLG